MKHLYIIDQCSSASLYGIGTYIQQIINIWRMDVCSALTIVKLESGTNVIEEGWSDGVRYLWFPSETEEEEMRHESYCLDLAESLRFCMNEEEDNIFLVNYLSHSELILNLKKIISSCRIIIVIHYVGWYTMKRRNGSYLECLLGKVSTDRDATEKIVYKEFVANKDFFLKADRVVCLSEHTYNLLRNVYGIVEQKIRLLYNGLVDEARILDIEQRKIQKGNLSFKVEDQIILYVGRLNQIKGVYYLINAFRKLLDCLPNVHLLVVGDGDYSAYLSECECIWSHVTFTGRIRKEKLYQLYQISDIGVLPSLQEQCSYVAIEMMMHGIPLIGTASTGLEDMIQEGLNGYAISIEDVDAYPEVFIEKLKSSMVRILSLSIDEKNAMRQQSRNVYLKHYTLNVMQEGMKELEWI
ncbi:TIGR04157 family glycosyltransferase [Bacteroides fragilis]